MRELLEWVLPSAQVDRADRAATATFRHKAPKDTQSVLEKGSQVGIDAAAADGDSQIQRGEGAIT